MPVSIYGQCADMTRINAIAEKHRIPVIEDGAQSFGATHHGKKSCGLSAIGCTSFFPSKPLGCYGDGGAIFTHDDGLAEKMRQIRVHGQKVKHQHPWSASMAVWIPSRRPFCLKSWKYSPRNVLLDGRPGNATMNFFQVFPVFRFR